MSNLVTAYEAEKRRARGPKQLAALERRYAKAREALERSAVRMVRAMNTWQKARALERRLGKELDREP